MRLNSGELLKTHSGTFRDFVYDEMGKDAPFLRHTNLSEKRFSRQFTLAQICINSFARSETGDFVRARYDDLEDFFKDKYKLEKKDENLVRVREVLKAMDRVSGKKLAPSPVGRLQFPHISSWKDCMYMTNLGLYHASSNFSSLC